MNVLHCPNCNRRLAAPPDYAGERVRCPHCRTKFNGPSFVAPAKPQPKKKRDYDAEPEHEVALSRPGQKIDPEELIDMTAMVDIVFFLLIFFLVTSMAGIQSSAKLPRPESQDDEHGAKKQQVDNPESDPNAIIVKINKDDGMEIDGVPYREIGDVLVRLRQLRNANGSDASMLVVGHGDASHGAAVLVLDAGYEVGIDRLRLAVLGEETE